MESKPAHTVYATPLAGITVLDLGQIYQAPYCGLLLALAGADVIKVEPPNGEPVRARRAASVPLAMLNSNKTGMKLDLKTPEGRDVFLRLVEQADVVMENFAPGVMERLGLGAQTLLERNPRLVYASASGYGTSGPNRDFLAMDLTIQAMSGAMHVTGYPDKPPVKAGPALSDFLSGTHLYGAIVTALFERERTGKGRAVEVAMQDTMFPALASNLTLYYEGGDTPVRTGNRHGALAMAPYNTYEAADGYVAVICVTEGHWKGLVNAMGRVELLDDPRFKDHAARCSIMDEVDALINDWTRQRTRQETMVLAGEYHFPCAPVRTLDEVVHDQHMHERGMLRYVDHPQLGRIVLPHSPLRFEGGEPLPLKPNPELGEHTIEILRSRLGLSSDEIRALQNAGVI